MIADLIEQTGEARAVDLASLFGVTAPTVNATVQRLQKDGLVISRPYRSIFLTPLARNWRPIANSAIVSCVISDRYWCGC